MVPQQDQPTGSSGTDRARAAAASRLARGQVDVLGRYRKPLSRNRLLWFVGAFYLAASAVFVVVAATGGDSAIDTRLDYVLWVLVVPLWLAWLAPFAVRLVRTLANRPSIGERWVDLPADRYDD